MATNAAGDIIDENAPDLNGLLGAILGKQVTANTQSGQATTSNTNTATQGQTETTGVQNTSSSTASGSQSLSNQSSSGTTQNVGTNRTTGSVARSSDTTQQGTTTQQTSADISGLQSVFDRQSAGITPEMLSAIFREGAKAAPQLVTAHSNALGARSTDNSPVAQVLKTLQVDLTSKAADLNRQLLSDAGNTAGKIGELTKAITGTNSNVSSTTGTDIQDLLTATDSKQISEQLQQTINNTQQQSATGGQTTNASTTNTAQNTVGSQNQVSNANEQKKTATTINTGAAKTLAGMFVGGVALDQIFRAMSGKGFTGTLADLGKQLVGRGANLATVNDQLVKAGFPVITQEEAGAYVRDFGSETDALWQEVISDSGVYDMPDIPDVPIPDIGGEYDFPDDIFAFADGGQPKFLPVPGLLKKQQIITGNPDADIDSLVGGDSSLFAALTGSGGTGAGASLDGAGASANPDSNPGPGAGIGSGGAPGSGPSAANGVIGIAVGAISAATGIPSALLAPLIGLIGKAVTPSPNSTGESTGGNQGAVSASPVGSVSVTSGEGITNDAGESVGTTGEDGAAGIGGNEGGSPGDSGGGSDGDGGGSDGDGGSADGSAYADGGSVRRDPVVGTRSPLPVGEGGGGLSRDAIRRAAGLTQQSPAASAPMRFEKGTIPRVEKALKEAEGYADGGEVENDEEDYHERLMEAMGITPNDDGGMTLDKNAVKMMHHAVTRAPGYRNGGKPAAYKEGGQIKGPGTGTSDSIPAQVAETGRPIKVSAEEFIIPADVVQHFGADAFQSLIDAIHTPVRK